MLTPSDIEKVQDFICDRFCATGSVTVGEVAKKMGLGVQTVREILDLLGKSYILDAEEVSAKSIYPVLLCGDRPIRGGRCSRCYEFFSTDIYIFRGQVLCGECRYVVRHNKLPPRPETWGADSSYDRSAFRGSQTLHRFQTFSVRSQKHADVLNKILDDTRLGD